MTQKRILIYLHEGQASWLVTNETGQVEQSVVRGNLSDVTTLVQDHEVQAIVPGQTILLTAVELPKWSAQRVMQALPFAVEEQLIDDVSLLHFAIGEYQANNHFPVAVVAKEKMDSWVAELEQAHIHPDAFIPAMLVLPWATENWYVCVYDEMGIIRTGEYAGFTCDKENISTLLAWQLAKEQQKPTCIHIYNFSGIPSAFQLDTIELNEIMLSENQFLEHVAQWMENYSSINLLQGGYQATKKSTSIKKIWIAASCLAIAWVGLAFFSNLGSFFILHHATASSEQLIDTIYRHHFPQASSVVAPRERMEEKLKKLSVSAGNNQFLSMLGIVAAGSSKHKEVRLLSMDFHDNQLILSVSAENFAQLDAFTQALNHQGLNIKQQSAGAAGTAVKATLLIKQGIL